MNVLRIPLILILIAAPVRPIAAGPQASQMPRESQDYEKRLARLKEDIDGLRAKIAEEEKKEKTRLSALARIGFAKSLARNEFALLSMQLDKNRRELSGIKADIPALQASLEREKENLARILVTLFKYGRLHIIRLVLESSNLATLLRQSRNLALLAGSQDEVIADYRKILDSLGQSEKNLKAKEGEIEDLIRKTTAKRSELDVQEQRNRDLVDEIKSSKKTYEQTLDELNRQAQELQRILQKLETQAPTLMFPLVPFIEKKGRIPWPTDGVIIQKFGIQRHPQYNTVTMNNGLEVSPPKDDLTIRAVSAGKVVFAEYIQGYGNSIILNHGTSYHTVYGHCSEYLVQLGEFVRDGQPIAVAGDTGSLVGVSLYFQISHEAKPLDPLQWLKRR